MYDLWKPENWKTLDAHKYKYARDGFFLTTDDDGCIDIELLGGGEVRRVFIRMISVNSDAMPPSGTEYESHTNHSDSDDEETGES